MRRSLLLLLLLFASRTLPAQDLSQFEKFLLPVFSVDPMPGLGALFTTQLYVTSPAEFRYFPAPGTHPQFSVHPAGYPFISLFATPREARGLILYIDRAVSNEVAFAYELRVSTSEGSHLTPLPVVREHDFLHGRARVAGVPSRGLERNHLRIYDLDGTGTLRVRVRVVSIWPSPGFVLADQIVAIDGRDAGEIVHPFYTERLLPACVPDPPRTCGDGRISVELEPLRDANNDTNYYVFVSSTDNTTQEVRIYTPGR
jgi:hypothetical protein